VTGIGSGYFVPVLSADAERAVVLADVMTADPEVNQEGVWTVQDVLDAALRRGLDALEETYLGEASKS
jgi:hypothetical protein